MKFKEILEVIIVFISILLVVETLMWIFNLNIIGYYIIMFIILGIAISIRSAYTSERED